ncbi:MAG: potassium-transporting ATPase subunit KdpA, partial [Rhodococcus sp. (in: high G+C Gram-positive bacteria)]
MNPALLAGLQIAVVIAVLAVIYVPLGDYMARVYDNPRHSRFESVLYRLCRIDARAEQTWVGYASSVLAFSFASVLFLYALQRLQGVLPRSGGLDGVSPSVAFN